jgi:hypothetical protein
MNLLFRSIIFGLVAALALGAFSFAVSPFFDAVGLYVTPASLLVPIVLPLIPSQLLRWMVPEGGPAAGLLFILVTAVFGWTIFFGMTYFGWASSRRKITKADSA